MMMLSSSNFAARFCVATAEADVRTALCFRPRLFDLLRDSFFFDPVSSFENMFSIVHDDKIL